MLTLSAKNPPTRAHVWCGDHTGSPLQHAPDLNRLTCVLHRITGEEGPPQYLRMKPTVPLQNLSRALPTSGPDGSSRSMFVNRRKSKRRPVRLPNIPIAPPPT